MKQQGRQATKRSGSSSAGKARSASTSRGSATRGKKTGGGANSTTDHDQIREWAESRGGVPSCVKRTGGRGDTGVLRIDFPGRGSDAKLQKVSWDEWFKKFDANDLTFLYQDKTATGRTSRFNKLVSSERSSKRTGEKSKPRTAGGAA